MGESLGGGGLPSTLYGFPCGHEPLLDNLHFPRSEHPQSLSAPLRRVLTRWHRVHGRSHRTRGHALALRPLQIHPNANPRKPTLGRRIRQGRTLDRGENKLSALKTNRNSQPCAAPNIAARSPAHWCDSQRRPLAWRDPPQRCDGLVGSCYRARRGADVGRSPRHRLKDPRRLLNGLSAWCDFPAPALQESSYFRSYQKLIRRVYNLITPPADSSLASLGRSYEPRLQRGPAPSSAL